MSGGKGRTPRFSGIFRLKPNVQPILERPDASLQRIFRLKPGVQPILERPDASLQRDFPAETGRPTNFGKAGRLASARIFRLKPGIQPILATSD